MSLEKVMMAIRSDAVMSVLMNFKACVWARIWSGIGMEVRSKNMTIRRRSLYFRSPGFSGAMALAVTALMAAGSAGLEGSCAGRGFNSWGTGVVSSSWKVQILTSCGLPSSVTVKSLAVRPLMGLPSLSFTLTISTISVALASNLKPPPLTVRGALVCCCAEATRSQARKVAVSDRIFLEVESQGCIEGAHRIHAGGEPELGTADGGIPVRDYHVIESVGGVETNVDVLAFAQPEGPARRSIQRELTGAADDVPAGIAPFA